MNALERHAKEQELLALMECQHKSQMSVCGDLSILQEPGGTALSFMQEYEKFSMTLVVRRDDIQDISDEVLHYCIQRLTKFGV